MIRKDATGCWLWLGSRRAQDRYGQFWMPEFGRAIEAHRAAWIIYRGAIPDGLQIDHLCENTLCVNPDHLELVTNEVNSKRSVRARVTKCKHGHDYDEANTGWKRDPVRGMRRYCRACARKAARRRRGLSGEGAPRPVAQKNAWPNC